MCDVWPHAAGSVNTPMSEPGSSASNGSSDSNKQSVRSSMRCPPSRHASYSTYSGQDRLDTIHSDSSAEAQAQYSAKSSNTSTGSLQLSNATAIVDSALKDSVSGSDPYSGRLPSILLSKELDDVPFQTRLQTVIEGLEQSNSPGGSVRASGDSNARLMNSDGRVI